MIKYSFNAQMIHSILHKHVKQITKLLSKNSDLPVGPESTVAEH